MKFQNRSQAGILLAHKLSAVTLDNTNTIVIALPRGGVPLANEIAKKLKLPLDILLVKKIGLPTYPELAVGFVSEENEQFYNLALLNELGVKPSDLDAVIESALIKMQEVGSVLRKGKSAKKLLHKDIILVDDGIASGSTILSAIKVLKKRMVNSIIIASPVIEADTLPLLNAEVDQIIVLRTPNPIYTVGEWYEDFLPVETKEVASILFPYLSY